MNTQYLCEFLDELTDTIPQLKSKIYPKSLFNEGSNWDRYDPDNTYKKVAKILEDNQDEYDLFVIANCKSYLIEFSKGLDHHIWFISGQDICNERELARHAVKLDRIFNRNMHKKRNLMSINLIGNPGTKTAGLSVMTEIPDSNKIAVFSKDRKFGTKLSHVVDDKDSKRIYNIMVRESQKYEQVGFIDTLRLKNLTHYSSKELNKEPIKIIWPYPDKPGDLFYDSMCADTRMKYKAVIPTEL